MIAFKDGDEFNIPHVERDKYIELLTTILGSDPFSIGSYHGALSSDFISEIINYIMIAQGYNSLNLTIEKEADGYHLGITIEGKGK